MTVIEELDQMIEQITKKRAELGRQLNRAKLMKALLGYNITVNDIPTTLYHKAMRFGFFIDEDMLCVYTDSRGTWTRNFDLRECSEGNQEVK